MPRGDASSTVCNGAAEQVDGRGTAVLVIGAQRNVDRIQALPDQTGRPYVCCQATGRAVDAPHTAVGVRRARQPGGEAAAEPNSLSNVFCRSHRPTWTQTARATAARSSEVKAPSRLDSRCLLAVAIWSAIVFRRSPRTAMYASAG